MPHARLFTHGRPVSPPPPPATTLAPHASWTPGTFASGFAGGNAAPTQQARSATTPAPIAKFWTKTRKRYSGADFQVGVYAFAAGGIASVTGTLEGGPRVTLTSPSLNTAAHTYLPSVNVNQPGFWFTVDYAAVMALAGSGNFGRCRLYVEVIPTDANMVNRVISIEFSVSDLVADHTYHFGTGQTYASLSAAIAQANTDLALDPLFISHTNGNAEMVDQTTNITRWLSWGRVQAAGGVVTNFQRTTPIYLKSDLTTFQTMYWQLRARWLEFYGPGIQVDIKNIAGILMFDNGSTYFEISGLGCYFYNSNLDMDTNIWNHDRHPGLCGQFGQTSGITLYLEECAIRCISHAFNSTQIAVNCFVRDTEDKLIEPGPQNPTAFVARNYVNGLSQPDFTRLNAVATVTCTKGGLSSAELVFNFDGTGVNGLATVQLKEDGAVVKTITVGNYYDLANFTCADVTAAIRAQTGWSATDLAAISGLRAYFLWAPAFGFGPLSIAAGGGTWIYNNGNRTAPGNSIVLDVLNKTGGLGTSINYHFEILLLQVDTDNLVVVKNEINNILGGNTIRDESGTIIDSVFGDNCIGANDTTGTGYQTGNIGGVTTGDNFQTFGISYESNVKRGVSFGFHDKATTSGSAFTKVVGYAGYLDNSSFTVTADASPITYSLIRSPGATPTNVNTAPNGANLVTDISTVDGPSFFVGALGSGVGGTGFDWRPDTYPLAHLIPAPDAYDAKGTLRSASDAAGAISKNLSAMPAVPSGF